jgi:hypothetical protein
VNKILRRGLAVLVVLATGTGFAQSNSEKPFLSICDIRSKPKEYLGQTVTVSGEVEATYHLTGLSSPKCPNVGAALVESASIGQSTEPTIRHFREGVLNSRLCLDDRPFVVTVKGRFGNGKLRGIPIYRIMIEKVLQAEFVEGTVPRCMNREIPAPDIKIAPRPLPDLLH